MLVKRKPVGLEFELAGGGERREERREVVTILLQYEMGLFFLFF